MKALIICLISGEYTLFDKDTKETFIAKPRGVFRNNKTSPKVGDVVEVKFVFDDIAVEGTVKKIDAFNIDLQIDREEVSCLVSQSPQNIIYIKKKD